MIIQHPVRLFPSVSIFLLALGAIPSPGATAWQPPEIRLPTSIQHPVVACTPEELERLRRAYHGRGPEQRMISERVEAAERALAKPVVFPPRGGQHNQWYQCEKCQLALQPVDETHHQCPKCKTVYRGAPYDDVLFARHHGKNLRVMEDAAWAYAITGEKKYAELAATVLRGYAERYTQYEYHDSRCRTGKQASRSGGHIAEQTLNEATMMARSIAPAYDLIHDSGVLSPADQEKICSGLFVPLLENIAKNKAGKSNWQTWHNAAFIVGGAMLGDVKWVRQAIEDPKNGFLFQMKTSLTGDGMWYENSWGYHYYTLSAIVLTVEAARRLEMDLWHHPSLKKMFMLPVEYAMPDGSLPRYGDDVQSRADGAAQYLESAWNVYRDPTMRPFLTRRPTWDSVLLGREANENEAANSSAALSVRSGSKLFPSAGHAILRTKSDAELAAAITFGPYGGGHGHYDKLSFVLFGYGQELGIDPGRARSQAYRLPIHSRWYKASLGHNLVLVDRQSQKPATGRLETFAANERYALVVARCGEAYPGINHRRLLCMTPDYLLVFDELAAASEHRYDWVYHNRGEELKCAVANTAVVLDNAFPGSEYIKDTKTGITSEPVHFEFKQNSVTTHLIMDGAEGTGVLTANGPFRSVIDRVPLVMVSRKGKEARFAAVLQPVATGTKPSVSSVAWLKLGDTTRITINHAEESDVVIMQTSGGVELSIGGKTVLSSPALR